MTPAPTAPADEVERFLDQMEIRSDFYEDHDTKRVLRLCRKYREALWYLSERRGDKDSIWVYRTEKTAREALAYTGTGEK